MDHPIVNKEILLEKYPGKGGWTYAEIPGIKPDNNNPFGWVKVSGKIDNFELNQYKLMPMGNGNLFLPVRAEIRKYIKKEAGDIVKVILFLDDSKLEIPQEIIECLMLESVSIFEAFQQYQEGEQKTFLDWIYSAKTEQTKANRIAEMINKIELKIKFKDKLTK